MVREGYIEAGERGLEDLLASDVIENDDKAEDESELSTNSASSHVE